MKKKLVIVAVVALVALVTAAPALASGDRVNGSSGQQFFSVLGNITGIDILGGTIIVQVSEGSRLVWPHIGLPLAVQTTTATVCYEWTPHGLASITLDDLGVGEAVNIHGVVAETGDFTAGRVILFP